MISALGWMRREAAASEPTKYRLTSEDYATFMAQAGEEIIAAHEEAHEAGIDLENELSKRRNLKDKKAKANEPEMDVDTERAAAEDEELAKYNLDDYNEDEEEEEEEEEMESSNEADWEGLFTPVEKLLAMGSNQDTETAEQEDEGFDSEELEDLRIRPSDVLIVTAKTEDGLSQLEVCVYEEEVAMKDPVTGRQHTEDNLYVHHDLMLPSFPLCVECIDYGMAPVRGAEERRSFAAVGSFEPTIELWSLDVLDVVYPTVTLGQGKKRNAPLAASQCHVDAVMALAWNRNSRNFLLSGGADSRLLLWDLARGSQETALRGFAHHAGKVQSLSWHPTEASVFLSGAYDSSAAVLDARCPEQVARVTGFAGDIECVRWLPGTASAASFAVSDESGRVSFFDTRSAAAPLLTLDAHAKSATCLDFCPLMPNSHSIPSPDAPASVLFLTGSTDKSIKLWSLDLAGSVVTCLQSREMAVGKVFAAGFVPDRPLLVAAGGSRGNLNFWNLKKEQVVLDYFCSK
jgi:periodic tryptophan protein 1